MLKFYKKMIKTYLNNELVGYDSSKMLTDKEPQAEKIILTWENLKEVEDRFITLPYGYRISKKGTVIYFFDYLPLGADRRLKPIKEWKQAKTNIHIEISYMEYAPSINEILDWHNGNQAIQYLQERGLTINGK